MHIQSNLYLIYKQNFYHEKKIEIDTIFDDYHITLLNDLDHPALLKERKLNIDAAAYGFLTNM